MNANFLFTPPALDLDFRERKVEKKKKNQAAFIGYLLTWASLVAQRVKRLPTMWETWV